MNELKLPEPDTHCLDDEGGRPIDVWSYSPELVRLIVAADRALREQAQPVPCPDNPAWHYERLDRLLSMTLSAESYEDYLYSLNIVAAPQAQPERKPLSETDLLGLRWDAKCRWNSQADAYNAWDDLGQDEQDLLVGREVERFHGIEEKP